MAQLARDERGAHIEAMTFSICNLSQAAFIELTHSKLHHQLAHLDLQNNSIGAEGLRALATSPFLHKLEFLRLSLNNLGPRGARALCELSQQHPIPLTHLDLSSCSLVVGGLLALSRAELRPQSVKLANNFERYPPWTTRPGDTRFEPEWRDAFNESKRAAAVALCSSKLLSRAREVDLRYMWLDQAACEALASHDDPLESLAMSALDAEPLATLLNSPRAVHLNSLELSAPQPNVECIKALIDADLPALTHLDLSLSIEGDEWEQSAALLERWPRITRLKTLQVHSCPLDQRLAEARLALERVF